MLVNASRQELRETQATKRACPRLCSQRALPGNSINAATDRGCRMHLPGCKKGFWAREGQNGLHNYRVPTSMAPRHSTKPLNDAHFGGCSHAQSVPGL